MKSALIQLPRGIALAILFTLSYTASAFYDPHIGRWLSRDPIGERGGLNPNGFVENDPIGRFDMDGRLSVGACDAAVQQALKNNIRTKSLLAELRKRKCPDPSPSCLCCFPETRSGKFDLKSKKIEICANSWNSAAGVISALVHELTHALDDCKGTDWSKCKERACSEIRAYDQGGTCVLGGLDRQQGETYRDCIRRKAIASTTAEPSCTAADVDSQMNACLGSDL